jgi:TRAP transporter 4TM/12TM fusion protein
LPFLSLDQGNTVEKMRSYLFRASDTVTSIIAIGMSIFHIYTSFFGILEAWRHRSIHLIFVLLLHFLLDFTKSLKTTPFRWTSLCYHGVFLALAGLVSGYLFYSYPDIVYREGLPNSWDKIFNALLFLIILKATYRRAGTAVTILIFLFLGYLVLGPLIPGKLGHPSFSYTKITDQFLNSTLGIFGPILGASSVFIVIFIIFGAFLEKSGAGEFFIELSYALMGKIRGGPALTAVLASTFIGMISGSAVANVATTGVFTIPLMKKCGYAPHFAGAVEAAASTGGQFMPPIMGSAIFLMVVITGIPYGEIIIHAALPALLYFFSVGVMVRLEALKMGLQPVAEKTQRGVKEIMLDKGYFLLIIFVLTYLLIKGLSPMKAGVYSISLMILLAQLRRKTRMNLKDILNALELGAKNTVMVAVACASAGIIVGSISLTGIGLKFASALIMATGGKLHFTLFFTMLSCILLGMGTPSVSAYIILAVMVAPALTKMGVETIAAHLFIYYFGIISNVTPPVALAAYNAASLAGSNLWKTGYTATRLAMAAFIVPFIFVYNPSLLLMGKYSDSLQIIVSSFIGVTCLAIALSSWLFDRITWFERILFLATSLLLIKPGFKTDLLGLTFLGASVIIGFLRKRHLNA